MRVVLADLGNSRAKFGRWTGGGIASPAVVEHGGDPLRLVEAMAAELADAEVCWIAQVLGAEAETQLQTALRQRHPGLQLRFARTAAQHGALRNAYLHPQRLGVDRWLAMVAGWQQRASAVLVVDAGTALTADAVDAQGQHLGGYIAAGLDTGVRAILGHTRFATIDERLQQRRWTADWGQDTEACVMLGALDACCGAIDRAAARVPGAHRILTGGDAQVLLPLLAGDWEWRPHLVLEGLAVLAAGAAEQA